MNIIDEKLNRLIEFKQSVDDILIATLTDIKNIIVELNANSQLFEKGVMADGTVISSFKPYTARTIQIKQTKGQPTDRVTLRDTGEFHTSIVVNILQDRFEIVAYDSKTNKLIEKYGESILGLTDENVNIIIWDYIYKSLISKKDSLL